MCHPKRVEQFKKGKHALGWASMKAMPTFHWQPMALTEGMKGCGGCHKIGLKTEEEIKGLKKAGMPFGYASCDSCHTRHTFSLQEARQPQACQTCHSGFRPSPVGDVFRLQARRQVPPEAEQNAARGRCGANLPDLPHAGRQPRSEDGVGVPRGASADADEDKQWAADRATILQGLGVLDPGGNRRRAWKSSRRRTSRGSPRKTGRRSATRCSRPATSAIP